MKSILHYFTSFHNTKHKRGSPFNLIVVRIDNFQVTSMGVISKVPFNECFECSFKLIFDSSAISDFFSMIHFCLRSLFINQQSGKAPKIVKSCLSVFIVEFSMNKRLIRVVHYIRILICVFDVFCVGIWAQVIIIWLCFTTD